MNKSMIGIPLEDIYIRSDYLTKEILYLLNSEELVTEEIVKKLAGIPGYFYKYMHSTEKIEIRNLEKFK